MIWLVGFNSKMRGSVRCELQEHFQGSQNQRVCARIGVGMYIEPGEL